jgi:tRNA threonylcarbamoyladenosine biosynthesis protein TsaE
MADRVFTTSSAEKTFASAKELARSFKGDEVVFLIGELGAGKTVFAKGIAAGLGAKDVHQVCSPTFTLMNVYQARVPIYHFDLYRLSQDADIRDLGFEDYIGAGVVIVEWAEKMMFPVTAIEVLITVEGNGRRTIEIFFPGGPHER